ncbi:MAG: MarR family transcriptional regulator, partial [Aquihabitans sp.]
EVQNHAPVRLSDLATSMSLDRSIASRQAESLVQAGFVERRPDPTDRRAALLAPTRSGRSVLTRLQAERKRWLDRAVSTLQPQEVDALGLLLPRLVMAIEQAEADADAGQRR